MSDMSNYSKEHCAGTTGTPYKKGDFIGQKYEVHDVLGMGGFGIVYLVYSHETEDVYALKTFRDEYLEDAQTRDRFKKEAQVWIDMEHHPYLVRAYFVDKISDRLFIGIEYIAPDEEGLNSLDNYLRRRPPDLAQSLRWGIQFCHGMEYAYSKGIRAHRDIKPANIMIGQGKTLKITDFGLAGVIGQARISGTKLGFHSGKVGLSCQTMEGSGFGTPTHMPPEQFTNAAACDERSDIYSFGIVLFQMATGGSLPFLPNLPKNEEEHKQFLHDIYKLHSQAPVPKLDSPLFPIIQRCLEKELNRRYLSFKDLLSDMEPILKRLTGEVVKLPEQRELAAWEWYNKGISLNNLGKDQEAIASYDRAIEINRKDERAWNNKGVSLSRIGKYHEALICHENVLEINPMNEISWFCKGNDLYSLDNYQEALSCYEKMLEINPERAEGWRNKGNTLCKLGKYQDALCCFEMALEINPKDSGTWYCKGQTLYDLSKHHDAISCYNKALEINPRYADVWSSKGLALYNLGNHQDAIGCYDMALQINTRHVEAWYNKALAEDETGRGKDATFSYKRFIELAPAQYIEQIEYAQHRLKELGGYQ